jgi:hypothetical protein
MDNDQSLIRRELVLAFARYLREHSRELRERAGVTRDLACREFRYGLLLHMRATRLLIRVGAGARTPPASHLRGRVTRHDPRPVAVR